MIQLYKLAKPISISSGVHHLSFRKLTSLPDWPERTTPTPFEIFGFQQVDYNLSQKEFFKQLKPKYIQYVKLYHPDVQTVVMNGSRILTDEEKRSRFDLIQNGYEILKDPRRRVALTRYTQTNWEDAPRYRHERDFSKENFQQFRYAHAHRKAYDFNNNEQFWQAGSWEDYYRMKHKREPPTVEEIEKNKLKILAGVLTVAGLMFALHVIQTIERTDELNRVHRLASARAQQLLEESYGSPQTSQFERLEKFLTTRRSTKIVQDDWDNNRDNTYDKDYDHELLTMYARQKVAQWDGEEDLAE